jgi:hypothetical protein
MSQSLVKTKVKKETKSKKNVEPVIEEEPNIVYHIKHKNMTNHYNSLKGIDIDNEDLKLNIEVVKKDIENKKKELNENMKLPLEIINNINNKQWIRIPYPIREIKLVAYLQEKNINQETKDKYLKLFYEKKLTSKVVTYNQSNGKIEDITIELP